MQAWSNTLFEKVLFISEVPNQRSIVSRILMDPLIHFPFFLEIH